MRKPCITKTMTFYSGGIAQLVERLPCTQKASGSNPLASTILSLAHFVLKF